MLAHKDSGWYVQWAKCRGLGLGAQARATTAWSRNEQEQRGLVARASRSKGGSGTRTACGPFNSGVRCDKVLTGDTLCTPRLPGACLCPCPTQQFLVHCSKLKCMVAWETGHNALRGCLGSQHLPSQTAQPWGPLPSNPEGGPNRRAQRAKECCPQKPRHPGRGACWSHPVCSWAVTLTRVPWQQN